MVYGMFDRPKDDPAFKYGLPVSNVNYFIFKVKLGDVVSAAPADNGTFWYPLYIFEP